MSVDPFDWIDAEAAERSRLGLWRTLVAQTPAGPGCVDRDHRTLINFASNDYLSLANDSRVVAAAVEAAGRSGWGAGASPLVSGFRPEHEQLSRDLAAFERVKAVALFPTGFAANLGAIAALVGRGDAVYSDRLNHASLVQGARLSCASLRVYPHGDADRLAAMLARDRGRFRRSMIVTDGVFSMDGDLAPLVDLVRVAEQFGAMLLVDEAHGTGIFGPEGRGACAAAGVEDRVPIRVGTLSKALGSVGGFVASTNRVIDHLINYSATLIYSTALPPAAAAAASAALRISLAEPARREHLQRMSDRLRRGLGSIGDAIPAGEGPIVPIFLGTAERATNAADRLASLGFLVPAIRPPTVPRGTARLRVSLTALHEEAEVDRLIEALRSILL